MITDLYKPVKFFDATFTAMTSFQLFFISINIVAFQSIIKSMLKEKYQLTNILPSLRNQSSNFNASFTHYLYKEMMILMSMNSYIINNECTNPKEKYTISNFFKCQ